MPWWWGYTETVSPRPLRLHRILYPIRNLLYGRGWRKPTTKAPAIRWRSQECLPRNTTGKVAPGSEQSGMIRLKGGDRNDADLRVVLGRADRSKRGSYVRGL